ncbi:MAG: TolC family protein [Myxococcota bacterium]
MMSLVLSLCSLAVASEPLTLGEALRGALEANPDFRTAELNLSQAEADVIAARGAFDPTLSLSTGYDQSSSLFFLTGFPDPFDVDSSGWNAASTLNATLPTGTSITFDSRLRQSRSEFVGFTGDVDQQLQFVPSFTATVSQDLLRGVKMSFNLQQVKSAALSRDRSELQLVAAQQQVLADVARAYWAWVYQAELAQIGRDSVAAAEEALRVARLKVEAGEQAPLEEMRLSAALVQAQTNALDANNAADDAGDQLLLLIGRAPGVDVMPASMPGDAPSVALDASEVARAARDGNLDLAVARTQVEEARLALAAARHGQLPSLSADLSGGFAGGNDESWGAAFTQLDGFPTFSVGGRFDVPLGNRAAVGQTRRAEAALRIAEQALARSEREIQASAATQSRTVSSAREKVALADANLALSEQTLAAQQALYDAGRIILSEVLDARAEVERTRAEAIKARTDFRLAEVELLRLQGGLSLDTMLVP